MPRPSINWLITDTHFYHDKVVEFTGRPRNYNELIMVNLRHLVAEQDVLYHLGDVIFYRYTRLAGMLSSVPCRKFLVMGNHDHKSPGWYMRNGFDGAFRAIQVDDVLLTHRPVQSFPDGVRFNVHGHFHNMGLSRDIEVGPWYDTEVHRLLALEYTDLKPVNLREFLGQPNPLAGGI